MFSVLLTTFLAASLGPMGADAPAHEPQVATNGSLVGLTFGAGRAISFSSRSLRPKSCLLPTTDARGSHSAVARF